MPLIKKILKLSKISWHLSEPGCRPTKDKPTTKTPSRLNRTNSHNLSVIMICFLSKQSVRHSYCYVDKIHMVSEQMLSKQSVRHSYFYVNRIHIDLCFVCVRVHWVIRGCVHNVVVHVDMKRRKSLYTLFKHCLQCFTIGMISRHCRGLVL